jgi:dTMP kinase
MARRFITFEGGEGTGKSTQARLLSERLRALGHEVVVTREPGGSPLAEEIRALLLERNVRSATPLAEALLFYAGRADHVAATIGPALDRGAWVVCDRFADSTRVYQGLVGGLDAEAIDALDRLVLSRATPELTLVLDIAPEVGLARAQARAGEVAADRYEARDLTYHRALREGFLTLARQHPARCKVIAADGSVDEVGRSVWATVAGAFQLPVA